jgi:hypothetical protein
MPHLDLTDEEAAALIKELADITGNDRYPFSRRNPRPPGHPRQAQTEAGSRALAAAETLRTDPSRCQEAAARVKSEPDRLAAT